LSLRSLRGSNLAEFAPALFIFLILILFPFLNLFGYVCGVSTVTLIANECATAASVSPTFGGALVASSDTAMRLADSPLGKFSHLQPVAGYNGTGLDVYIAITDIASQAVTLYGPNKPLAGAADTSRKIYEYQARVNYTIAPFMNMAGIPLVRDIPILGRPAQFTFTVHKAAEYPDGLASP